MNQNIVAMTREVELDIDKMKELSQKVSELFKDPMKELKDLIGKESKDYPVEMSEIIHSHITGVISFLAPGAELEVNALVGYKLLTLITKSVSSKEELVTHNKQFEIDPPNYFG